MLTVAEIRAAAIGSWQLLTGDARGMKAFDLSIGGFYRSFAVFGLLIVPFFAAIMAERKMLLFTGHLDPAQFPDVSYVVVQLIAYVLGWLAFPLLFAAVAGVLGLSDRYVPYIVARNWTTLLGIVPYFIPALLFDLDIIPAKTMGFFSLFALSFNLYYSYVVTRIACLTPVGVSIALVVVDVLLTLLIGTGADRLLGL